jgi:hypothetical protein
MPFTDLPPVVRDHLIQRVKDIRKMKNAIRQGVAIGKMFGGRRDIRDILASESFNGNRDAFRKFWRNFKPTALKNNENPVSLVKEALRFLESESGTSFQGSC